MEKGWLIFCSVSVLAVESFDQRGLANPWLARDEDDLALAVQCFT